MKTRTLITLAVSVTLMTPMTFARNEQLPSMYTATTGSAITTTTMNGPTIKSLGEAAEKNSNKGKGMANAAMAVAAAGVVATCMAGVAASQCKMWVMGLAASVMIRGFMGGASNKSAGTVAAVSTFDDPYNLGSGATTTTIPGKPSYTDEPDWKNAMATIDKLKKDGWQVDLTNGNITDPNGKKFNTAMLNSPSALQAAGISASSMKAYESAMAKGAALAAEKLKSADATSDMFGDTPGGGGAKPTSSSDGGLTPYGGLGGSESGQKLGVDRDPAQVAGMSKDFNGNPIGVSQDSLFKMIDRRYELHNKNGSFLSP
ncbi:MAG: hypothetical protein ACXWC9_00485 [Pseudobdellovibrionaceae bacterium]